jgi:ankyrin repeat protein
MLGIETPQKGGGGRLLHLATSIKEEAGVPLMRCLLDRGADPSMPNAAGALPHQSAAGAGATRILRLVLRAQPALVDAQTCAGVTALMVAADKNNDEMARMLVEEFCADSTLRDNRGRTAADRALESPWG